MDSSYKLTGNSIPVSLYELIKYTKALLFKYDRFIKKGLTPKHCPYTEPIIYTLSNGKQIQVPKEIQMNAIKEWNHEKKNRIERYENVNGENDTNNKSLLFVAITLILSLVVGGTILSKNGMGLTYALQKR